MWKREIFCYMHIPFDTRHSVLFRQLQGRLSCRCAEAGGFSYLSEVAVWRKMWYCLAFRNGPKKCVALIRNDFGQFRTMYCPEMPEIISYSSIHRMVWTILNKKHTYNIHIRHRVIVKPPASAQVFEKRSGLGKFPQKAAEPGEKGICISAKKEGMLEAPLREN